MNQTTLRYIRDAVRTVVPVAEEEITLDRDFKALGADSIDRLEIIGSLRRELGIKEPIATFAAISDIGALAEFCELHAVTTINDLGDGNDVPAGAGSVGLSDDAPRG